MGSESFSVERHYSIGLIQSELKNMYVRFDYPSPKYKINLKIKEKLTKKRKKKIEKFNYYLT